MVKKAIIFLLMFQLFAATQCEGDDDCGYSDFTGYDLFVENTQLTPWRAFEKRAHLKKHLQCATNLERLHRVVFPYFYKTYFLFSQKRENQKVIQQTFLICIIQSNTVHIIFRIPDHVIKLSFFTCSKSIALKALKRMHVVEYRNAMQIAH